ncbi:MAG TPA: hypothetical protein VJ793_21345 [Anaerolineae bacterium]|nr:hypothetical protein [Anaerolineae bacterium]
MLETPLGAPIQPAESSSPESALPARRARWLREAVDTLLLTAIH